MSDGFKIYKAEDLRKVNSMRRAVSQPNAECVPTLSREKVLFVPASGMNNEPASCYNCAFYNAKGSCQLIGPHVTIRKFVYPKEPTGDAKRIEYWPCCGMHQHGEPTNGAEVFLTVNDPAALDLIWINAPRIGQECGGANCGGGNGGDDCDYYMTEVDEKRDAPTGFCRVLQSTVHNGDVCCAWNDDDKLPWEKAQDLLREIDDG